MKLEDYKMPELCMNTKDLQGMPMVGARFKGTIWMQGFVR